MNLFSRTEEFKPKSQPITETMVTTAYKRVNKSSKGRGIDNVSFADFEKEKSNNLYKIWNRMASGSYFPPAVKEVEIPKPGSDKMRVLGVGTIGDRVAQNVGSHYKKTMNRIITIIFLLITIFSGTKIFAQSDHLEPANSVFTILDYEFEYYSQVRNILFKDLDDNPEFRFLVMPSFSPENVLNIGLLCQEDPKAFCACTPAGVVELLVRSGVDIQGKHVAVVGRSLIVGKPVSLLLARKHKEGNATVTLCHSRTQNLPEILKTADIIVAAIGFPQFIKADMVKEGAIVIDVGINRIEDASRKRGYRLVGDVDFDNVAPKCSHITPVPGGVGPMTVAMLMKNTVQACSIQNA